MSETARDRACGIISGGRVKALEDAGLVVVEQGWVPSLRAGLRRCEAERDFERQRADGLAFNLEWETRDANKLREENDRLRTVLHNLREAYPADSHSVSKTCGCAWCEAMTTDLESKP